MKRKPLPINADTWLLRIRGEVEVFIDFFLLGSFFVLAFAGINILIFDTSGVINGIVDLVLSIIVLMAFLFRKALVIEAKVVLVNMLTLVLAGTVLATNGLSGTPTMVLFVAIIMSFIFLRFDHAIKWLVLSNLLLLGFTFLVGFGVVTFDEHLLHRSNRPLFWLNANFGFLLISGTLGLLLRFFRLKLSENLSTLEHIAFYDSLTGLPNRRHLAELAERILSYKKSTIQWVYLIDIKDMRALNAVYGTGTGDEILSAVGRILSSNHTSSHLAGRFGGSEFIGLIHPTKQELPLDIMSEIRHELISTMKSVFPQVRVEFFFAWVEVPNPIPPWDMIVRQATLAMRHAKERNSDTLVPFEQWMRNDAHEKIEMRGKLEKAIENKEFLVYYQPKIDIRNGKVLGVEALARWNPEENGFVGPSVFIPLLTKLKLIYRFGDLIIDTILRDFPLLQKKFGPDITCSVNVSPLQFLMPGFSGMLKEKIEHTSLSPSKLVLEITEDVFVEDLSTVKKIIEEIHSLGFGISLDDFGTGYSSLSYLTGLKLSELKLDKTFVDTIASDPRQFGLVKQICELAEALDLGVIVEGVETTEQLDLLLQTTCRCVQGYIFAKPEPL